MKKAVLTLVMVICFVGFTNAQQKEGTKKETSKEVKACCADKKSSKKECTAEAKKTCDTDQKGSATEPKKACCSGSKK